MPTTDDDTGSELTVDEHGIRSDGVDVALGVAYQRAGQVRQALAELRNNEGPDGNPTRAHAARKHLAELGYNPPKGDASPRATKDGTAAVDARKQPPEGRSATPPSTVKAAAESPTRAQTAR